MLCSCAFLQQHLIPVCAVVAAVALLAPSINRTCDVTLSPHPERDQESRWLLQERPQIGWSKARHQETRWCAPRSLPERLPAISLRALPSRVWLSRPSIESRRIPACGSAACRHARRFLFINFKFVRASHQYCVGAHASAKHSLPGVGCEPRLAKPRKRRQYNCQSRGDRACVWCVRMRVRMCVCSVRTALFIISGARVDAGNIIVRQRGTNVHPGVNVSAATHTHACAHAHARPRRGGLGTRTLR